MLSARAHAATSDAFCKYLQAETYRRMRKATKGDWRGHAPATNTLWLHYLADIMLTHKLPDTGCTSDERLALRNFRKRAAGGGAADEMVWDDFFAGQWSSKPAAE